MWFKYNLELPNRDIPPTITISYGGLEQDFPLEYARFGARGVGVFYGNGDDGVGHGDCHDSFGNVQFMPIFPASCTCGNLSSWRVLHWRTKSLTSLPRSAGTFLLALAERRPTTPRSRVRLSTLLSARGYHRRPWCPPSSSTSATIMPAYTSAFAVATIRPDQFIICNLRSPGGRGIPDITAQAHWHQLVLQH